MRYEELSEIERKALNTSMFKAYDIRTKSAELHAPLMVRLVKAIGRYFIEVLQVSSVVVGRDARLAAPALLELAIEVFADLGLNIIVNPLQISTCQFYFSCMQNPESAAVMFTASHNPGTYIGMKLMAPGLQTLAMDSGPKGGITCIREFYCEDDRSIPSAKSRGSVKVHRYLDAFISYSLKLAGLEKDSLKGTSILIDYLCGAAGTEVTEALQYAGATVRARNLIPDGRFPAGDPNPIIAQSIKPTWDMMKSGNYDFGFCFDGDGDRMDIMTKEGEQITPSFNLSILIPQITDFFKKVHASGFFGTCAWDPHMYYDVKANPLSVVYQAKCGIGVHIIRNGHSFIKEALRKNLKQQYLVASEESAHYYMNFPFNLDDYSQGFAATENTLYFTLLTAKVWAASPQLYTQALQRQQSIFREREWPCHFFSDEYLEPVVNEVEDLFRNQSLKVFTAMEDGSSLDATLMRYGLAEHIDAKTDLGGDWLQIAQRISRSEEGMARWEVASSSDQRCKQAVAQIKGITDRFVKADLAVYE
ncbi:phosphomannomutase [Sphaerochaeta globosa]|uniref:Phosphomannomutase n=1 Tax=Sphaerochaeta globosa (strain ATCC BAA-1886 / DSM 22777 / Buddy) TaxID=158189 RepID=F0RYM3_SPHGB|nr:phosphomannomutase [Sphaerochaeta globosa]ADY12866.1 Phosphomannomutase [Sphaerochaeta globosa str. Buddy]